MFSHSARVWLFVIPWAVAARLLSPRDSTDQNTGVVAIPFRRSSQPRNWTHVTYTNIHQADSLELPGKPIPMIFKIQQLGLPLIKLWSAWIIKVCRVDISFSDSARIFLFFFFLVPEKQERLERSQKRLSISSEKGSNNDLQRTTLPYNTCTHAH